MIVYRSEDKRIFIYKLTRKYYKEMFFVREIYLFLRENIFLENIFKIYDKIP